MIENHGNISRAFAAFDRRGDGFVTLDELKRVLFNFAFPMSDKLFVELMDRYEKHNNYYWTITGSPSSRFERLVGIN